MQGTFDPVLVTLSFIIAAAAALTTLELTRRVAHTTGIQSSVWVAAGATAMGLGIWTAHFVGMLAYSTHIAFRYNIPVTAVSVLVGIGASAYMIRVASRGKLGVRKIVLGGCLLGTATTAMQFIGMAAMEMAATTSFDPVLVAASLIVAIVGATIAIWIASRMANSHEQDFFLTKLTSAGAMGASICGMHHTAMQAMIYIPDPAIGHAYSNSLEHTYMALFTSVVALIILGTTHLTISLDYKLAAQKQLGEQAEQEAVQLSEMLDDSSNEIYVFDCETSVFVKCNKRASDNTGYSLEQLATMSPCALIPNLSPADMLKSMQPLVTGEKDLLVFENELQRVDGTTYPINVHIQLSRASEKPVYIAIVADVTEKKQLEKQMMQARKLESIGQLAAGIAHEINTPAQFVGDNIRFLRDSFGDLQQLLEAYRAMEKSAREGPVADDLFDAIDRTSRQADADYLADEIPAAIEQSLEGIERVSKIVLAMKEFSHPGRKDKELVDLNKTIVNTLVVASNEWKYVAEIVTNFAEDLPPVSCDPQEISQVVLNLIVNAAHAIAEKNGENAIEKGVIRISTAVNRGSFEIRLEDNGVGIPINIQERIFDPFFTTKDVGKGTGQGLAMAYSSIVDKHHGSLQLRSKPGKGAMFIIRLPMTESAPQDAAELV